MAGAEPKQVYQFTDREDRKAGSGQALVPESLSSCVLGGLSAILLIMVISYYCNEQQ